MPIKSDAQRRAFYAAASGRSKLGIPASVARKYIREDKVKKRRPGLRDVMRYRGKK